MCIEGNGVVELSTGRDQHGKNDPAATPYVSKFSVCGSTIIGSHIVSVLVWFVAVCDQPWIAKIVAIRRNRNLFIF